MNAGVTSLVQGGDPQSCPLDYISASRLKCFQECRLKFYFRYVERIPTITSPALFIGTVTHAVLQQWNLARWRGEPSDTKTMEPVFEKHWTLDQPEGGIDWNGKEDGVYDKTWNMLKYYFSSTPIPVDEKPEAVEVVVESDLLEQGLPPLKGIIDLVREGGRIVDFKTAARTPSSPMVEHHNDVQLGCYALLYRESTGHDESGFELHHLIKTKEPKLVVTAMEPMAPDQIRCLKLQMESYVQGVQMEDYVPSPGQQCMWCDYFVQCQRWKGGVL